MSTEDVNKLEELFRMGCVLEHEYKQKKKEFAAEGIIVSNDTKVRQESLDYIDPAEVNNIPRFKEALQSNDYNNCLLATQKLRKLASIDTNPPLAEIVNAGIVPFLVQFLRENNYPQIQYESAWSLTNIASGPSALTKVVAESGAIPELLSLMLNSTEHRLIEQSIWALGNIVGDSVAMRDGMLSLGLMGHLINVASNYSSNIKILKISVWVVSNLCRGRPQPDFQIVSAALPMLHFLMKSDHQEILCDTLWSFSYLSDGANERIDAILSLGLLPQIVEFIESNDVKMIVPALRTVGNIATGNDAQTQTLLQLNVLPKLYKLLFSEKSGIRREACWTLSNIAAGNRQQVQALIDADIFPTIIDMAASKLETRDVRKEATWVLANAVSGALVSQIEFLITIGAHYALVDAILTTHDENLTSLILDGFERIMVAGKKTNKAKEYKQIIENCLSQLEKLSTNHMNQRINDKASGLISSYFSFK